MTWSRPTSSLRVTRSRDASATAAARWFEARGETTQPSVHGWVGRQPHPCMLPPIHPSPGMRALRQRVVGCALAASPRTRVSSGSTSADCDDARTRKSNELVAHGLVRVGPDLAQSERLEPAVVRERIQRASEHQLVGVVELALRGAREDLLEDSDEGQRRAIEVLGHKRQHPQGYLGLSAAPKLSENPLCSIL